MPFLLSTALRDDMVAHAASVWPEEACGLVAGHNGRALHLYPVENMRHSPVAFEMEPVAQVRAMMAIEAAGLELVAIYHSHPTGPARPSTTDIAAAYYPDAVQLIISLADRGRPELRAFTIVAGQVAEVAWALDDGAGA